MRRRRYLSAGGALVTSGCLRLQSDGGTGKTPPSGDVFEVRYANEQGTLETIFGADGVARAGGPRESRQSDDQWVVPITLTGTAAERFVTTLREAGAFENPSEHLIFVYFRGREVHSFQLTDPLVRHMQTGDFQDDPTFLVRCDERRVAEDVSSTLRER